MTRKRSLTGVIRIVFALSAIWLFYALYLDMKYERFPEVLMGGVKILLFFYFLIFVLWSLVRGIERLRN